MCGFVGRVNADRERRVDDGLLQAATRSLVHRGPDGEGLFLAGNVGLGHRRLAIVDVAGGAQPMSCAERGLTVVFNGEIYNHELLRSDLVALGYTFQTRSDTEVLLHGYAAWGDAFIGRLQGMFAFALWDARRRRLLLARDRVGIKPLYWTRVGSDVVFASEVKALFHFPDVVRGLNDGGLPSYLALRYVPGPATLFEGIERLQPGHQLVWDEGRVRISRYWDLPVRALDDAPGSFDARAEADRLRGLFERTVQMHLMGEVPVGVFLSGGLDSTAVTWAMKRAGVEDLKSFSVGFDDDSDGELPYARLAAQALGTEHREVRVGPWDFFDSAGRLAWHLDEPLSDGACIPLMQLAKRAREEVVVVLSGEGADELLGGYAMYGKQLAVEKARRLGGSAVPAMCRLLTRLARHPKARRYLSLAGRPLEQRYFGIGRGFDDALLTECFGVEAFESLVGHFAPYWERTHGADPLHRLLYNDTQVWLPDDLLVKADKMTMSWAIELRVPFLDHVMLENAWRLPTSFKLRDGVGKWLLREALRSELPSAILQRPKKGFPVPIGRWLRTTLHAPVREKLLAAHAYPRLLLGSRRLERLFDEHARGQVDRTEELFALWALEEWHEAYLAPQAGSRLRNEVRTSGRFERPRPLAQLKTALA